MARQGEQFERLVQIMARLRAPDGCPWDRKQTFDSIRPHTVEETYEVLEAIAERDWPALTDELGDLLLQILFYAQIAAEQGLFTISDVVEGLSSKLVRRHPHVFEDDSGTRMSPEQALGRWEEMKASEKKRSPESGADEPNADKPHTTSILAGISKGLPAMVEAYKLSTRAAGKGFEWPDAAAVIDKLEEEIEELRHELQHPQDRARLEDEVGDMFFTVVNIARRLGLEPESALKRTNAKFRRRFQAMESSLAARERSVEQSTPEELDAVWTEVKRNES